MNALYSFKPRQELLWTREESRDLPRSFQLNVRSPPESREQLLVFAQEELRGVPKVPRGPSRGPQRALPPGRRDPHRTSGGRGSPPELPEGELRLPGRLGRLHFRSRRLPFPQSRVNLGLFVTRGRLSTDGAGPVAAQPIKAARPSPRRPPGSLPSQLLSVSAEGRLGFLNIV